MVARVRRKKRLDRRARPQPYTGFVAQPQQQQPRSAFKPPSGSTSTTTGLSESQDSGSGGMLSGLVMGKTAVDTAKDMYDAGVDANTGFSKMGDWVGEKWDDAGDALSGLSMPDMPWETSQTLSSGIPLPTDYSKVGDAWTSLGGDAVGVNSAYGSPEVLTGLADPASGLLADSTGASEAVTGLQAGSGSGIDKLGAAGSALGLGMNIYDMVDGGLNFGNVTGALGSGILGAGALGIGGLNAWNPYGWGLLAASAADSIFDLDLFG